MKFWVKFKSGEKGVYLVHNYPGDITNSYLLKSFMDKNIGKETQTILYVVK